jgi:hypothetical protein
MDSELLPHFREPFGLRLEATYAIAPDEAVTRGLVVASRRPGEPDSVILHQGETELEAPVEVVARDILAYAESTLVPFAKRFFVLAARVGRTVLSFRERPDGFVGFRARLLVDLVCAPAYERPTGVDLWIEELPANTEADRRILLHLSADEDRHARRIYAPALRPEIVDAVGRRVDSAAFDQDPTWDEARAIVVEQHCTALVALLTSLPERG